MGGPGAPAVGRLPLVDAVRAIAALLIFAYHAAFVLGGLGPDGAGPWLAHLNVGVPLFFAISGFLLYRPFVAARAAGRERPSLRAYARRRVLRILPAYWVALTVVAVALDREEVFGGWRGALTFYGFLQAYDASTITGGIGQAWTLSVEVAFYAVLPLAVLAAARRRWGVIAGIVVVSVAWKVVVGVTVDPAGSAYFPLLIALPAVADLFAVGMALAVVSVTPPEGSVAFGALARAPGLAWLAAAAAFATLGTDWPSAGPVTQLLRDRALEVVVVLGLLLPAVLATTGGGHVRRLLASRPLAGVGVVSYGVYLWHLDVLRELESGGLPGAAVVVLGLAGSLALGAASWYGIERPAIAWRRRSPPRTTPLPAGAVGDRGDGRPAAG